MFVCTGRFRLFHLTKNAETRPTHIHTYTHTVCFLFSGPQAVLYACLNLRNRHFFPTKNALLVTCEGFPGSPQGAVHTNTQTPYTQTHKPRTHKHTNPVHTNTHTHKRTKRKPGGAPRELPGSLQGAPKSPQEPQGVPRESQEASENPQRALREPPGRPQEPPGATRESRWTLGAPGSTQGVPRELQ